MAMAITGETASLISDAFVFYGMKMKNGIEFY